MVSVNILTSCVTLFGKNTQLLAGNTALRGADVYVNGFKVGVTPVELALKADRFYVIEFRKTGYRSVTCVINTKIGAGVIVLDVLKGLVPVIVDAVTGDYNELSQEAIDAALEKE